MQESLTHAPEMQNRTLSSRL